MWYSHLVGRPEEVKSEDGDDLETIGYNYGYYTRAAVRLTETTLMRAT
jgi:hypothetical protein